MDDYMLDEPEWGPREDEKCTWCHEYPCTCPREPEDQISFMEA